MRENSRRDFLGSLGPLALASLIGAAPGVAPLSRAAENTEGTATRARSAASSEVEAVKISTVPYPNWPLQSLGAVIVHGNPEASGKNVFESQDRQITGGLWKCSPGSFDLTFTWDEMALMLEGELIIEESSGRKVRILPGDFFFVPRGVKTRWIVVKPLQKLFFSREQPSDAETA